jgi:hypothetical protein
MQFNPLHDRLIQCELSHHLFSHLMYIRGFTTVIGRSWIFYKLTAERLADSFDEKVGYD